MNLPVVSHAGKPIELKEGRPASHSGFLLGLPTWYEDSAAGLIVLQQKIISDKYVKHFVIRPNVKLSLKIENEKSLFNLLINLGDNLRLAPQSERRKNLRSDQYILSRSCSRSKVIELKPGKEYEFFDIGYIDTTNTEFIAAFPFVKDLSPVTKWLAPAELLTLTTTIRNGYTEEAQKLYYDIQFSQLLFNILYQYKKPLHITARDVEIEAAHKARRILIEDLRNYPDINQIARRVGLSNYKLKIVFRQVFESNLFDMHLKAKMEGAYQQVISTELSIKVIAIDAGYKWPMNFATAFRKYFGEAPETLRAKLRNN